MSKRAEEKAMKAYPDEMVTTCARGNKFRAGPLLRRGFQEGYEQAEQNLGWHSVEDCLPPVDEEVIVLADRLNLGSLFAIAIGHIVKQETYKIKIGSEIKEFTSQNHNGWNIPGVKFWMPLPKIPEE